MTRTRNVNLPVLRVTPCSPESINAAPPPRPFAFAHPARHRPDRRRPDGPHRAVGHGQRRGRRLLRLPDRLRHQHRHQRRRAVQDHPKGARPRRSGIDDHPRRGRVPGVDRHQDRGHSGEPDHHQGPGERQERERPLPGRGQEQGHRRLRGGHQPQQLRPRRVHGGRPARDRPQRVPHQPLRRAGVQGRGAGQGDQHQARLRGRRRRLPRHHGHPHLQHVLERRRRRVRAVPQPRRRLAGGQLGDPVVRDARLGRRQQQVQVPQLRGRLRRHEPQVDRPAPLRQRHQQRHRRPQLDDQHLRRRVLRREGERAPQPDRGQ